MKQPIDDIPLETPKGLNEEEGIRPVTEDFRSVPAPFPVPRSVHIRRDGDTEDLLNGMIAELHYLMREVALPSACCSKEPHTRQDFLGTAQNLAITGAAVAKAIAKLRKADRVTELRHRQTIEHVARTLPPVENA